MTNDLRDLLDSIADGPANAVHVDARTAWADGARRRVRRRVQASAIGVAAVAAVAMSVPLVRGATPDASFAGPSETRADHYPRRLDYDYVDNTMPAVTGPLAGVVNRAHDDWFGSWVVSPGGRMWHLDNVYGENVSISPDGVHLLYLRGPKAADALLTITDQVTGTAQTFDDISVGAEYKGVPTTDARYFHSDQSPAFWNQDSTKALIQLGVMGAYDTTAAGIVSVDGDLDIIQNSEELPGGSHPIGWVDGASVAFVTDTQGGPRVAIVDVRTSNVVRTFMLRGARSEFVSQWYGSLAPDGNSLMAVDDGDGVEQPPVRFYSARGRDRAGATDATVPAPAGLDTNCQPMWTRREVYLPVIPDQRHDAAVLYRVNGGTPIVADPRLHVTCSVWASSALEGGPDPSLGGQLFGTDSTWLSWHWRELAGCTFVVLAGVLALTARAYRRKH